MRNAFGIFTRPLSFRESIPERLTPPFRDAAMTIVTGLGVGADVANSVVDEWWALLKAPTEESDDRALIDGFRRTMAAHGIDSSVVSRQLNARAERILEQIWEYLLPGSIVDWGCGDGDVTRRLADRGRSVFAVDVVDERKWWKGEFHHYDESLFPPSLAGRVVDIALVLTVLHHARSPGLTLGHIAQLKPRRMILIESVPSLKHPVLDDGADCFAVERVRYEYCGFVDWLYNRVLHEDVQTTYNYLSAAGWDQLLAGAGYRRVAWKDLGIDQPLVPEWHALMVYDRIFDR